jgi:transposase
MVRCQSVDNKDTGLHWVQPPWTQETPQWLAIETELPPDHLARHIAQVVEMLDLTALYQTYTGRGSAPHPPDVLLKVVLYEMRCGRHRPAQWAHDQMDSLAVRWLTRGLCVARSRWYAFRERVGPLLDHWHQQVVQLAMTHGLTDAARAALDGSTVAAQASRYRLLNAATLEKRLAVLEQALARDAAPPSAAGETAPAPVGGAPAWLAPTPQGRRRQHRQYQRSRTALRHRHAQNQQRRTDTRQPPEKVVLSPGDPEAPLGLDKCKVYRPLYNVQWARDLDSPLILAADVFAQPTDAGTLGPMLRRQEAATGRLPQTYLTDAGYATALDLALCAQWGVTLYAPYQENAFSAAKRATRPPKQRPKSAFLWLPTVQTSQCPGGHQLVPAGRERKRLAGGQRLEVTTYRCAPAHCLACPQHAACVKNPQKGRTIKRHEHEALVEALRARMATAEARALYKLRCQTVELGFADVKEHRELRRFSGKGQGRARTEIGLTVLVHNGLIVLHALRTPREVVSQGVNPKRLAA